MLGQRRRRWPNIKSTLDQRPGPTLNQHWINASCLLEIDSCFGGYLADTRTSKKSRCISTNVLFLCPTLEFVSSTVFSCHITTYTYVVRTSCVSVIRIFYYQTIDWHKTWVNGIYHLVVQQRWPNIVL